MSWRWGCHEKSAYVSTTSSLANSGGAGPFPHQFTRISTLPIPVLITPINSLRRRKNYPGMLQNSQSGNGTLIAALKQGGYVLLMRHARSPEARPDKAAADPEN